MDAFNRSDLDRLPTVVDIPTAARALGISRSYAYILAKEDRFPCRVIRVGTGYRVPTAAIMTALGEQPRCTSHNGDAP
ncbi:DNA-binding protein [Actinomadura oligospora]|uniref:DNA-binding protein n=1 Tax=Actinomadura oligospora TaxID=111804 RepID=UPI000479153B|nr:DNA-binding protein [Actinomadura oligospora]